MNINKLRNKDGKIWLNVASSTCFLEGFINIDNHIFLQMLKKIPFIKNLPIRFFPKSYQPLISTYIDGMKSSSILQHDCRKPLNMPNNSADHILCSHFLEHVYPDECSKILDDFYRILKPGGGLHIIVPDMGLYVKNYLNDNSSSAADTFISQTILSKPTRGSIKFRFLEFFGGYGLLHHWMYDVKSMTIKIKKSGFFIQSDDLEHSPSYFFNLDDDSAHVNAVKKI